MSRLLAEMLEEPGADISSGEAVHDLIGPFVAEACDDESVIQDLCGKLARTSVR